MYIYVNRTYIAKIAQNIWWCSWNGLNVILREVLDQRKKMTLVLCESHEKWWTYLKTFNVCWHWKAECTHENYTNSKDFQTLTRWSNGSFTEAFSLISQHLLQSADTLLIISSGRADQYINMSVHTLFCRGESVDRFGRFLLKDHAEWNLLSLSHIIYFYFYFYKV